MGVMIKMNKWEFDKLNVFQLGNQNDSCVQYFKENGYLNFIAKTENGISFANATFEPFCKNNWHIHKAKFSEEQVLICIVGFSYYGEEKLVQRLSTGDIVVISANVKHWHGVRKESWFSHIVVEVLEEETLNEYLKEVGYENIIS